jgi:hypothetical protein
MLVRLVFCSIIVMADGAIPSSKSEACLFFSFVYVSICYQIFRTLWLTDTPKGC